MDLQKIGCFLAELRKSEGLTQAQLGEEIGVSGKTISRWETGTYLPPVEMLLLLSRRYHVPINDLVLGERSTSEVLPQKAEEAVIQVLRDAPFLWEERRRFWRNKWRQDHRLSYLVTGVLLAVVLLAGVRLQLDWLVVLCPVAALGIGMQENNRMMAYVEHHLYDEDT